MPAALVVVEGRMGTGKTDFALLLAEKALEIGVVDAVATNIATDRFKRICCYVELVDWLEECRALGYKPCYVLDEADSVIDARNPLSKINKKFRELVWRLRKYRGKMIIVTHRWEDLEAAIRPFTTAIFRKVALRRAVVELAFEYAGRTVIEIDRIPKTSVRYDTYDVAPFEYGNGDDLDLRDLIVAVYYAAGMRQADIGKMLGITQQAVSKRIKKVTKMLRAHNLQPPWGRGM